MRSSAASGGYKGQGKKRRRETKNGTSEKGVKNLIAIGNMVWGCSENSTRKASGAIQALLGRLLCADPTPPIGVVQTEPVPIDCQVLCEPQAQAVPKGSYGVLGDTHLLPSTIDTQGLRLSLWVYPTLRCDRTQTLLSWQDATAKHGLALELAPDLRTIVRVATQAGECRLVSDEPLPLRAWAALVVIVDPGPYTHLAPPTHIRVLDPCGRCVVDENNTKDRWKVGRQRKEYR